MADIRNKHILVIEDDPGIAAGLIKGLEIEGFRVSWKDHGQDGINFAQTNSPDLIILDVRLPDGSGFDFCRQIRELKLKQPILMLTIRSDEMDKVLGLEMGADDYMTKPFGIRELVSRIRALLRRAYGELSSSSSDLIYIKDIVIDRLQGRASRGENIINLTPTEFRLLIYMAEYAGQALRRAQILAAVWDADKEMIDERVVNVHIRRLREKIELDPGKPELILTVPGIGYRLVK
jgi:two-component system alkaline phosphatase synthesis response regulator PhoP